MAKKNNTSAAVTVGVGVAAAAAAAAGAYWLYGAKHSAQHRRIAKSWMLKARAEVMEAVENLEEVDREKYMKIVEGVVKNYAKGASAQELSQMMKDFKATWGHMQQVKKALKKPVRKAKKVVSKTKRKASKSRK